MDIPRFLLPTIIQFLYYLQLYFYYAFALLQPGVSERLPGLAVVHMAGAIVGAIATPFVIRQAAAFDELSLDIDGVKKIWPVLMLIAPALILRLPGIAYIQAHPAIDCAIWFSLGLHVPLVFTLFFSHAPRHRMGLLLGLILLTGLVFLQFYLWYFSTLADPVTYANRLLLLFQTGLMTTGLLIVVVIVQCIKQRDGLRTLANEKLPLARSTITGLWIVLPGFFILLVQAYVSTGLEASRPGRFNLMLVLMCIVWPVIGYLLDISGKTGFWNMLVVFAGLTSIATLLYHQEPSFSRTGHGLSWIGSSGIFFVLLLLQARIFKMWIWQAVPYSLVYAAGTLTAIAPKMSLPPTATNPAWILALTVLLAAMLIWLAKSTISMTVPKRQSARRLRTR